MRSSAAVKSASRSFGLHVSRQITISYGTRSNDDWLQYFGFVPPDNDFDRYVLALEADGELEDGSSCVVLTRQGLSTWSLERLLCRLGVPNNLQSVEMPSARLLSTLLAMVSREREQFVARRAIFDQQQPRAGSAAQRDLVQSYLDAKLGVLDCAMDTLRRL